MPATDSQRDHIFNLITLAVANPENALWGELEKTILGMRAAGTPCGRLVVPLQEAWPQGQRFAAAYAKAQEQHKALPDINWQGPKSSAYHPDRGGDGMTLEELMARSRAEESVNRQSPFAKLEALKAQLGQ